MVVSKQEILEQIQPGKVITAKLLTDITNLAAKAEIEATLPTLQTKVSQLSESINDISEKVGNENLIDPSKKISGYLRSNGSIEQSTSYSISDYIELEENTDYYVHAFFRDALGDASRKIVLLYDNNKNPISSTYINLKTEIVFNSSSYKFARVCWENEYTIQLSKENLTTYIPYKVIYENKTNIGKYTTFTDGIIDEKAIREGAFCKYEQVELFDVDATVIGIINDNGNIDPSGTIYRTSDFIAIKENTVYTISPRCRIIAFFNEDKKISKYDSVEKFEPFDIDTNEYKYFRFSYNPTYGTPNVSSVGKNEPSKKLEEGYALSNQQMKSVENAIYNQNLLFGKKWVVVGDSFTNGDDAYDDHIAEGKYKGKRALYHYLIGNRNVMDIVHFAAGGRVMTCPSDIRYHNSFSDTQSTNNYTDIPSLNPDYITIWLGINDSKAEQGEVPIGTITLGTINDTTVNTFYGAWNVVLKYLIQNCPYAHIGVIVSNGCTGTNFPNAIKEVCRKWGIAYLDLNGDYTVPLVHRVNGKTEVCEEAQLLRKQAFWVSETNGHPNAHAQAYQSTFIENFLRSI